MNMCQVMMRMNDQRIKSSLKFCMCRYVLRLYLSIVAAEKDNILTPSVTGALSRTTQFMYKVKGLNNNDLNKVNSSGIGSLQNSEESMIVTNGIDLLLDLLSQIWKRFNSDLEKSILLCSDTPQMSDDGFDAQPFAEYLKSTNQDSAATSAQISNNGKSSSSQFKDSRFLELMDSGAYAAAVIRSYSTQETDRKRLVHSGTVEIMSDGMKMIESNKTVQQIAASKTASKYTDAVVGKISQLLVQLVGAIRNFAIDSTGRAQLLSHRMVVRLCNAQRIFKKHPDLLLNCARVTAKLSLQDNFRAQINSKPNNIKCLAEVIVTEGILCNRVMEGSSISTN